MCSRGAHHPPVAEEVEQVVKCLVDFTSPDPAFLSFKAHNRLDVLDSSDPKFYKCRHNGKVGLVSREKVCQDASYTLRRAAEKKQEAKEQFRAARAKEAQKLNIRQGIPSAETLETLKAEQDRLQQQRELMKLEQAAKKEARQARQNSSFADRVAEKQRKGAATAAAASKTDPASTPPKGASGTVSSATTTPQSAGSGGAVKTATPVSPTSAAAEAKSPDKAGKPSIFRRRSSTTGGSGKK